MSCNLDLLHVGIWTFYSGCSLLLASTITYGALGPVEKENLLTERNKIKALASKQTSYSPNSSLIRPPLVKKMNFLV